MATPDVRSPAPDALISALRPCIVAVIGDVMLDRYVHGSVGRLSPEAPIQVLEARKEDRMLGGAANVAHKVVGLGSKVQLVGLVGEDSEADEFRALINESPGITPRFVIDRSRPTTVKTRFIAQNQQLLRVDREIRGEPGLATRTKLAETAYQTAIEADVVILEDYGKGVLSSDVIAEALRGAARARHPRRRRP